MPKLGAKSHKQKAGGTKSPSAKTHRATKNASSQKASSTKNLSNKAFEVHSQPVCREPACENLIIAGGYCRLHYIKNWQRIKRKEAILIDGRLQQYIEELVSKYSEKYIEAIRHDLMTDDGFVKVITELDLHETEDEIIDIDSSNSLDEYPMDGVRADIESREDDF